MAAEEEIRVWLKANKRECPICHAGAEMLTPYERYMGIHPDGLTERGINTSYETEYIKIKCSKCGFDQMELILEDVGL